MLDDLFALPDAEEREYLLAGLGRLVALRGPEPLVAAPLLLPEPEFWPDAVETRGRAAATLLRRLLSYAGLGELGVDIEVGAARQAGWVEEAAPGELLHHAAGWFLGIEDGVCHFGLANSQLRDEEVLIGTLGHEVAHAYRDHHGLIVSDHDVEEQLTDLTTVYLGFGFFTLQSSFRFRTGHYDEGGRPLLYERQTLGYLRPGQLALLLAAQLVIRKRGERELRKVLELLAPNHARAVERAHRELSARRVELVGELGLPSPALWPEPQELADVAVALGPATVRVTDHHERERDWLEEHKVAFRVRSHFALLGLLIGGIAGGCSLLIADVGAWMWALALGLGVAGHRIGRRIESARCSSCGRRARIDQDFCNFCETRLVGSIEQIEDRMEAEERYWAERRAAVGAPEARRNGAIRL